MKGFMVNHYFFPYKLEVIEYERETEKCVITGKGRENKNNIIRRFFKTKQEALLYREQLIKDTIIKYKEELQRINGQIAKLNNLCIQENIKLED